MSDRSADNLFCRFGRLTECQIFFCSLFLHQFWIVPIYTKIFPHIEIQPDACLCALPGWYLSGRSKIIQRSEFENVWTSITYFDYYFRYCNSNLNIKMLVILTRGRASWTSSEMSWPLTLNYHHLLPQYLSIIVISKNRGQQTRRCQTLQFCENYLVKTHPSNRPAIGGTGKLDLLGDVLTPDPEDASPSSSCT